MKLHFNCPVCATNLKLSVFESEGPCPTCQNILQVEVQVKALEPALGPEGQESRERKVRNWTCSGTPHGFLPAAARA